MNIELLIELAALALAGWIAAHSIRRPPALDWARLFKVSLSTILRGEVERAGGDVEDWRRQLIGRVLYNPAGRDPAAKLLTPDPSAIQVPALEGERGLVAALAALDTLEARWGRMYCEDPLTEDALMGDPDELGLDYAPGRALAPGLDWEAVAGWSTDLVVALERRLAHVVVVSVDGWLMEALKEAAPGLRLHRVGAPEDGDPEVLGDDLVGGLVNPEDRLLILAEGDDAWLTLQALHEGGGLRDRVAAVVLGGALLGGKNHPERASWMTEHFTQEGMDTEIHRAVPYLCIQHVSLELLKDGVLDLEGWHAQTLVEPAVPATGRRAVDVIDLGPLVKDLVSQGAVARALMLTLAFRLA